jgi:hypothetical protein
MGQDTTIKKHKAIRRRALWLGLIALIVLVLFCIIMQSNNSNGSLWDSKGRSCLAVTEDFSLTRFERDDCQNSSVSWSFNPDGSPTSIAYYNPEGTRCVTNNGDGTVAQVVGPCTGDLDQEWTYRDRRWVSVYSNPRPLVVPEVLAGGSSSASGGPSSVVPVVTEWCLVAWKGFLHGGQKVGLRKCSDSTLEYEIWQFIQNRAWYSFL